MRSDFPADPLAPRTLSRRDGPFYRQVAEVLRTGIVRGALPVGTALPSEAQLAQRFGVSLITVRQALQRIEADGLIRKRPGKAAIVAAAQPAPPPSWRWHDLADIAEHAREARLDIRSWRRERDAGAAAVFGLPDDAAFPCLRGRLIVAGVPETQVSIYFPPEIGARLARADFDDVVVFRSVQRRLGLVYAGARVTVRAEIADAGLALALDYEAGRPVLVNEITYLGTDGRPIEFTVARHRADLYSLHYDLVASPG